MAGSPPGGLVTQAPGHGARRAGSSRRRSEPGKEDDDASFPESVAGRRGWRSPCCPTSAAPRPTPRIPVRRWSQTSSRPATPEAGSPKSDSPAEARAKATKLPANWPNPAAVLVVSGEMDGYLEPCGCAQGQLGGLIRRLDFVDKLRAQNWPVALIDLGSLIKDPAAARGGSEQAKIKFGIALKAFSALKYNAVALSAEDLKVGIGEAFAQFLNSLGDSTHIVVANVQPGPGFESRIQPSQIITIGPVNVGVTSVIDPEALTKLTDPDKADLLPTIKKPDDVLGAVLAELEPKSQFQVLMVQGPPELAKRLATAYPGFDVVLATSQFADLLEREPLMLNDGKTMMVQVGKRGKYVGAVGFFPDDAQKLRFHLVTLDNQNDKPGSPMKKIIEDEYRSMLKAAGIVESFPRHDYTGGTAGATFVGAETCKRCHPNTYMKWSTTKHAQAFVSLGEGPQARCDLRRRVRELPHDGLRVQLGMAVRGRDAPPQGQPVRELPRTGVQARVRPEQPRVPQAHEGHAPSRPTRASFAAAATTRTTRRSSSSKPTGARSSTTVSTITRTRRSAGESRPRWPGPRTRRPGNETSKEPPPMNDPASSIATATRRGRLPV